MIEMDGGAYPYAASVLLLSHSFLHRLKAQCSTDAAAAQLGSAEQSSSLAHQFTSTTHLPAAVPAYLNFPSRKQGQLRT